MMIIIYLAVLNTELGQFEPIQMVWPYKLDLFASWRSIFDLRSSKFPSSPPQMVIWNIIKT